MRDLVDQVMEEVMDDVYSEVGDAQVESLEDEPRAMLKGRLEEVFNLGRIMQDDHVPSKQESLKAVHEHLDRLNQDAGEHFQEVLRFFLLESLDRNWKEHLLNMDHLKQGIGLRGYGQRDPKREYKREGFEMFEDLLYRVKENALKALTRLRIQKAVKEEEFKHKEQQNLQFAGPAEQSKAARKEPIKRAEPKVGRNDPCPCGSGIKHKKCCG